MAKQTAAELANTYGFAEAFFRAEPELWSLFQQALKGQWSIARWQGEFMKTAWFRARQASIRQWTDLTTRDPAEAEAKIVARMAELSDQFTQLGVTLDDSAIRDLATQSLQWAWSQAQMANVIADHVRFVPGQAGGIAAMASQIRQMAYDYGVTVSDDQTNAWIKNLVSQTWTQDNIRTNLMEAAKSKYAGLAPQLDAGRTVRDIAGQHIAEYARLLEVDAGNVSLDDPILAKALQGAVDPKTGVPVPQTVFQMSQDVKRDKRWLKTKNARDSMADAGFSILRDMGLVS